MRCFDIFYVNTIYWGFSSIFAIIPHAHNSHRSNQKKNCREYIEWHEGNNVSLYYRGIYFLPSPPPPQKIKTKKHKKKTPTHKQNI